MDKTWHKKYTSAALGEEREQEDKKREPNKAEGQAEEKQTETVIFV